MNKKTVKFKDDNNGIKLIDIMHDMTFEIPGLDKKEKDDVSIKYILIEFANPKYMAISHLYPDISDAVEHASHNLYSRNKIKIKMPILRKSGKLIIKLEIPKEKAEKFTPGNHLRGISNYLLKLRPDYYKQIRIGARLLNYADVSDDITDFKRYRD